MVSIMIKPSALILFAAAVAVIGLAGLTTVVEGTKYSVCDQDKSQAEISNVVISDCETLDGTCPFVRGFNKSIELDFKPTRAIEQVKVKVAGKLSNLPVPFHINPDNACGNYGFDCPLEAGKTYKLKITMPILRTYPKINVDVFLRLIDEKGQPIGCVEMPARIQEPAKETVATV